MLVYGDQTRTVDVRAELARLQDVWRSLSHPSSSGREAEPRTQPHAPPVPLPASADASHGEPWIDAHGRLGAVFIGLSELLQGAGDHAPAAEPALLQLTLAAAGALRRSWDEQTLDSPPSAFFNAARAVAPERLTVKTGEGYAFYALYPETYGETARALPPDVRVIGLRSIGAGLACVVAEAAGAPPPLTVRPAGHPFARSVDLPPLDPAATYAVVDEGPGLSGSSFGAVADALEAQGVAPERIIFLPGHPGDLGPQASEAHRRRWAVARRLHVGFDAMIAPQLPGWVEDLTGPAAEVRDLSGGAWRALAFGPDEGAWPPAAAHQERRKLLVRSARGAFLLKFAGLGDRGLTALERARALHAAGFGPEPLGWRHGFLVERWLKSRPLTPEDRPALLDTVRRYLAFRAAAFPAPEEAGADLSPLAEMARVNVGEALGPAWSARLPAPPRDADPRVFGDARLHAWEWRVRPDGRLIKTDAADHAAAHDLVGAQPPEWDRAGAIVELDLTPEEASAVGAAVGPFWLAAYAAFQLGLWTQAAEALGGWPAERDRGLRQAGRYRDRLERLLST